MPALGEIVNEQFSGSLTMNMPAMRSASSPMAGSWWFICQMISPPLPFLTTTNEVGNRAATCFSRSLICSLLTAGK